MRKAPRSSQSHKVFLPKIRRIAEVSAGKPLGQEAAADVVFMSSVFMSSMGKNARNRREFLTLCQKDVAERKVLEAR